MKKTPIYDFVKRYTESDPDRLHMPGHKGQPFLGCEALDITEVPGADTLSTASGIILRSENNATALFGAEHTYYSTEGASQCIKAMLLLALQRAGHQTAPTVLAARNAHQAFLYACALLDLHVQWLYPQTAQSSICSCPVEASQVAERLDQMAQPPIAVYLTSPDYLGSEQDLQQISQVCRQHNVPLLVDNAHGAYLKFLPQSRHPLDLGADLCCDSAHKTLPVLTGGAYLHVSKQFAAPEHCVRKALAMFGSTSPSYLILQSLDLCNAYLQNGYRQKLTQCIAHTEMTKRQLQDQGWTVLPSDPLKISLACNGRRAARLLHRHAITCEYADDAALVSMVTPQTPPDAFDRLVSALGKAPPFQAPALPTVIPQEPAMSIRQAIFAQSTRVSVTLAEGKVCAAPLVSCPPAIAPVVSGERISQQQIRVLLQLGMQKIDVVAE